MRLTAAQRAEFEEQGYLFLPSLFTPEEMDLLNAEVPGLFAQQRPEVWREKARMRRAPPFTSRPGTRPMRASRAIRAWSSRGCSCSAPTKLYLLEIGL